MVKIQGVIYTLKIKNGTLSKSVSKISSSNIY